jgi:DNA-binding NtrC family response regulator
MLSHGGVITPEHMDLECRSRRSWLPTAGGSGQVQRDRRSDRPSGVSRAPQERSVTLRMRRPSPEEEQAKILDALKQCAGNQTRAAEVLGMSRRTLINRLSEYGIARPRK